MSRSSSVTELARGQPPRRVVTRAQPRRGRQGRTGGGTNYAAIVDRATAFHFVWNAASKRGIAAVASYYAASRASAGAPRIDAVPGAWEGERSSSGGAIAMRLMPTRRVALFALTASRCTSPSHSAVVWSGGTAVPGADRLRGRSSPTSVASGDLDGDGWDDLVVACFPNSLSVLPGNSEGLFGTAKQYAIGPPPTFAWGRSALRGAGRCERRRGILDVAVADSADEAILHLQRQARRWIPSAGAARLPRGAHGRRAG
jgi:hypothetical protein